MRFNGKELASVALQPSHKFDKEGVLFIQERQDGLFRRKEAFTPRFCRLRGNMLFYFKTAHQCSEPAGVFILEHYKVELEDGNFEGTFRFHLAFDGDKNVQHFATSLESERDTWIQALHMASYEYMRSQLKTLQEKLGSFKQDETCHNPIKFSRTKSLGDSSDEPFLEMSLACDNLICDGDGTPPNPMLIILLMTPPDTQWQQYMRTEILERCSNPCFLTTVGMRTNDNINSTTRVKISAHDVRERLTSTMTLIGSAVFTIAELMEADKNKLRLSLQSTNNVTVGFVTVIAWQNEPEINSSVTATTSTQAEQGIARSQDQSFSVKLSSRPRMAQLAQLNPMYDNIISQTYRFHTGLGADLSVHEIMAESRLTFKLPQSLLILFIKEEKEHLNCITSYGELAPDWNKRQVEEIELHLQLINSYTQALTTLDSYDGPAFKASARKAESGLEFAPLNLHLQRLWVQNDSTKKSGAYDVLTTGAFAAHTLKFKNGGLFRMLSGMKSTTVTNSDNRKNGKNVSDKLTRAKEVSWRVRSLRHDLCSALDHLNLLAGHQAYGEIQTIMNDIQKMACQITKVCEPILIEEACRFLEEIRLPGTLSANGPVHCKRNLSPYRPAISNSLPRNAQPCYVQDKDSDAPSSIEEKNTANRDCARLKFQHRRAASDAVLFNDLDAERNESDSLSLRDVNISKEEICKKNCTPDNVPSPNLSRRLGWKLQRHHSAKEEVNNSCNEGVVTNNNNSLTSFFRRPTTKQKHEWSLTNVNCPDKNSEIGSTKDSSGLRKSFKSMSLRSLNGSKVRSQSPDELEPWEASDIAKQNCIIQFRRDIVFSQALTSAVAGIMTKLSNLPPHPLCYTVVKEIGLLLEFEGLLSCNGDEMGMMEDMMVGIGDLEKVIFKLEFCQNLENAQPSIEGHRASLVVSVPVPDALLSAWQLDKAEKVEFSVTPVFFNIGINEQATFAERFGDTSLQDRINLENIEKLKTYYDKYKALTAVIEKYQKNSECAGTLIERLTTLVHRPRSKNVEVLHTASEICRLLGGVRFTSCKSAKDRTSMSVTLEQCFILRDNYELSEEEFQHALDCMRCEGTRRENTLKNAGVKKYAFNSLQLMALPRFYRPPPGTYGNVQT